MQLTAKGVALSPRIGMKELARISWMSSGTERKMSSTKPSGSVVQPGSTARVTPNMTPRTVPPIMAMAVISSVQPAPCARNQRSLGVTAVWNMVASVSTGTGARR